MAGHRFRTALRKNDRDAACSVELPFDPKEAFGKVRAPVVVRVNDHAFRTTIAVTGGRHYVVVNQANLAAARVRPGDEAAVEIELDTEPRVVTPPPDFASVLRAHPAAHARWKELSYSHKKEYVAAIEEAKKPETRARRIARALSDIQKLPPKRR
jgi:Bacteriocin-protection, YdeI or OmpD-Associated/Domain of unknown function (DUF1905)